MGVEIPHAKEQFWEAKGRPIVKYREWVNVFLQVVSFPVLNSWGDCRIDNMSVISEFKGTILSSSDAGLLIGDILHTVFEDTICKKTFTQSP